MLGIVWKGEEAAGVLAYGYWPAPLGPQPVFPAGVWSAGSEHSVYRLGGADWRVILWTIRVERCPDPGRWSKTIESTLRALIDAGALVAWCATDDHFADPPALFEPAHMSDAVWAALPHGGPFECTARLGEPIGFLSDVDLLCLCGVARLPTP